MKAFEENRLRPFRLKIHDIRLFMRSPESLNTEEDSPKPEIVPKGKQFRKKVGELGAGPYEIHFRPGRLPEAPEHPMVAFFLHSHVEAPEYNSSCKEIHPFAKGSVFLSVCVNEIEEDWSDKREEYFNLFGDENSGKVKVKKQKQLYRIDIPLKCRKELKSERITMSNLMNLGADTRTADRYVLLIHSSSYLLSPLSSRFFSALPFPSLPFSFLLRSPHLRSTFFLSYLYLLLLSPPLLCYFLRCSFLLCPPHRSTSLLFSSLFWAVNNFSPVALILYILPALYLRLLLASFIQPIFTLPCCL